jgi:hypothetical protein
LAYAVHVLGDDRVIDELGGALNLLGKGLAEGDFVFERIEIDALADIAVADGLNIFLGILGMDGILLGNRLILGSLRLRGRRLRRCGWRRGRRLCLARVLA